MSTSVAQAGIPAGGGSLPVLIPASLEWDRELFVCLLSQLLVYRQGVHQATQADLELPTFLGSPVLGSQTCATTPDSETAPITSYQGLRVKMT